jgi:hypothetical protein
MLLLKIVLHWFDSPNTPNTLKHHLVRVNYTTSNTSYNNELIINWDSCIENDRPTIPQFQKNWDNINTK